MSTHTGRLAETRAAEYLKESGYQVLETNWRTRFCEIDIVALKDECVYFVEVKYRAQQRQGSGLDYITERKLQQMSFAAEMWVSAHKWQGDYALSALEVSGEDFEVTAFIPDCL